MLPLPFAFAVTECFPTLMYFMSYNKTLKCFGHLTKNPFKKPNNAETRSSRAKMLTHFLVLRLIPDALL